jgi:hypothetical protein
MPPKRRRGRSRRLTDRFRADEAGTATGHRTRPCAPLRLLLLAVARRLRNLHCFLRCGVSDRDELSGDGLAAAADEDLARNKYGRHGSSGDHTHPRSHRTWPQQDLRTSTTGSPRTQRTTARRGRIGRACGGLGPSDDQHDAPDALNAASAERSFPCGQNAPNPTDISAQNRRSAPSALPERQPQLSRSFWREVISSQVSAVGVARLSDPALFIDDRLGGVDRCWERVEPSALTE